MQYQIDRLKIEYILAIHTNIVKECFKRKRTLLNGHPSISQDFPPLSDVCRSVLSSNTRPRLLVYVSIQEPYACAQNLAIYVLSASRRSHVWYCVPSSTHRDDLCMTPVEATAVYVVFRGPRSQIALRGKIRGYLLTKKSLVQSVVSLFLSSRISR